ncbi:SBBP repeat-containing protein [Hymenobacter arizonensis]|uniref:Por secretion system C-terminal sorting domain-containing protein n=1 Tax=Hymenobacter arizonensis TaxID=1227077 RepID=A0A1I5XI90_HYMAR|nr:SBBP repeat-containing protein [Hymenobacter arizonensis]SFQ31664.1 Por secretion system C-terminal sorting domain-containing protein [Hymenobacter arizonensis]
MKKTSTPAWLTVAGLLTLSATAVGQPVSNPAENVRQEWVVNSNAGFAATVQALRVATDAAGNVYTLGQRRGGRLNSTSYVVTKYSPAGQELWQESNGFGQFSGTIPTDMAVDAAGNVYITGWSNFFSFFGYNHSDYTTVKISSAGHQVWVSRYDGPQFNNQPADDYASAIAVDGAGNVYVTGNSDGAYATVKYNAAGQQVWARRYNGEGSNATDVAVDAAGNVAVTGGSVYDFATLKYSPTGQQLWAAKYNSPTNGVDLATTVAFGPAGNVVVTGSSAADYATVSYAPDGQQQWAMRYNGPGNGDDAARDLQIDAAGNVFVTGVSQGAASGADYATLKYAPGGQLLWEARYTSAGANPDQANALALDAVGNTYVTGAANGLYATIKYDAAGQQRWLATYQTPDNSASPASAADIALDPSGNVLVTGNANANLGLTNIATIKYKQEGVPTQPVCVPLQTAPRARPDQLATNAGTTLTFSSAMLVANDSDPLGRPLQVTSIDPPRVGTLTQQANGTFTYTPPAGFRGQVELTYFVQESGPVLASRSTGHYYEFVAAPGICWLAAQVAAAGRTYRGMQGYLATITALEEQNFLKGRQNGAYWFGASDKDVEGEWRWKTGPEAGQLLWKGDDLSYTNWLPGQPDDFKNQWRPQGEDYGMLYGPSGFWNDLDECATGASIAGYVVEYGGLEPCTPTLYSLSTVTITVGAPTAQQATMASATAGAAGSSVAASRYVLEAYPNPSNGTFQVHLAAPTEGPAQVAIFDLQGRLIRTVFEGTLAAGAPREVTVAGLELAPGLYQLRLRSGGHQQWQRLIIQ